MTEAVHLADLPADGNPVVVAHGGRCPSGVLAEVVHDAERLDLVLVEADVRVEAQSEVRLVYGDIVHGRLEAAVLRLSHVAVLRVVARSRRREFDEKVLCRVPVVLERTVEASAQEGVVDAEVARDGRFPLQVRVRHGLRRCPVGRGGVQPSGGAGAPGLHEQSCRDVVVACGTIAEAELQVVEPALRALHEGFGGNTPGKGG